MTTSKNVVSNELNDVLANVSKIDTKTLFKNENITLPSGHDKAIVSANHIYGYVSPKFGLVKPMDVFEKFGSEFEKYNLPFETKGKIDTKGNYELRFIFTNQDEAQSKKLNDPIRAMLAFGGGLAGSRSSYINDMVERLVCLNGMTRTESEILMNKVRNTKKNHDHYFGIDFDKLMPLVETFINNHEYVKEQSKLIDMELKTEHVLPFFYEVTKGTKFPESKFQDAYDRMKLESETLGFTAMNRYLAYAGLNYILEHDSMKMDLVQTKSTDMVLASKLDLNIGIAVKNFKQIEKFESERISSYMDSHGGKQPRGKRKILELV